MKEPRKSKNLQLCHVELAEANAFVKNLHRHHKAVAGHKFSLGCLNDGKLCGVVIVGRPVARMTNQRDVIEVLRLCTDGTENACSFLYGAAARAGKALGYKAIQTFILKDEPGTTLRAAGWDCWGDAAGGEWTRPSRARKAADAPQQKTKWGKKFCE